MKRFEQKFTIHPVGQGLFYSGIIKYDNTVKFRMVFDCGSITRDAGEEEVDIYRDIGFTTNEILDLLVISHFDKDHINQLGRLLADDITVKKIVMPFITFEERIFLVARTLHEDKGYHGDDDYFLRFIIDPIGTLSGNFDDDSEVVFIESDPEKPVSFDDESQVKKSDGKIEINKERFKFDFKKKEEFDASVIHSASTIAGKIFKTKDSEKGQLFYMNIYKLMEFVFYRRSIGVNEEVFFNKVKELFFEEFKINSELTDVELLPILVNKIKSIRSATKIKEIFKKAIEAVSFVPIKGLDLLNMNSTALCMLHRNLDGLYDLFGFGKDKYPFFLDCCNITKVQKIAPDISLRIVNNLFEYPYHHRYRNEMFRFPNVLLTSDSFLLTPNQVTEFLTHYQNYLEKFWLFQIPHHGSKNNSDKLLLSQILPHRHLFINYGIIKHWGGTWKHPSTELINDVVATGHSSNLISVNETTGLIFGINDYGAQKMNK